MASYPFLIGFLGKHSQELKKKKKLGILVINFILPKLLVTYGKWEKIVMDNAQVRLLAKTLPSLVNNMW